MTLSVLAGTGSNYLVDIGQLVPVSAVNARSAFHLACMSAFGTDEECPFQQPQVYQLGQDGEFVAVYE